VHRLVDESLVLLDAVEAAGRWDRRVAGRSVELTFQFGHAVRWTEESVRLQLGDMPSDYRLRQQRIMLAGWWESHGQSWL